MSGARRLDRPGGGGPRRRELALAWAALAVLAFAAYLRVMRDGGFSLDDWANGSRTLQGGDVGDVLAFYWELTSYRPVLVLYVPLTHWVLGGHMGLHLGWSIALALAMSGALYGVLRQLRLGVAHAWALAALVLVFPWFDSIRMWATASMASLAIALALFGLWAALVGLERRSWRWHALALVLYASSILTYEISLLALLAVGLVYVGRVGWRAARLRWAADVGAVGLAALWVGAHTPRDDEGYGLAAQLDHLRLIGDQGLDVLALSALPLGPARTTLVVGVLAFLAGTAAARSADPALRRWLLLGAAGLAVTVLGWVIFTPAHPYYSPSPLGYTNRVNALAGVGLVLLVYSALGVAGALLGRLRPGIARLATATTLVLAAVLGAAYLHVLDRHADHWVQAFRLQMGGLGQLRAALPDPPPGTVLLTAGYPAFQAPGVPVFSSSWDLNNAVRLQYDRPDLQAYPLIPGAALSCTARGVLITGAGFDGTPPAPYGKAVLFDLGTGRHVAPADRTSCARAVPAFPPGEYWVSDTY